MGRPGHALSVLPMLALLYVAATAKPLRADVLVFTDGHTMEGKVTRIGGDYRIETSAGASRIPAARVLRVEKKATVEEAYALRCKQMNPDDANAQIEMGNWCKSQGMTQEARWHFMLAVALRPDDAKARKAAGFIRQNGEWITHAERMRRKGYAKYGNRWLERSTAERRFQDDQARATQEKAYRDAWAILRRTTREAADAPLEDAARELRLLATDGWAAIRRGSSDANRRVRALVITTLGLMDDEQSLELLLDRLRGESSSGLRALIVWQLRNRPDRLQILNQLLEMCINDTSASARKRAAQALRGVGDVRAIEALLPQVAFCPVPQPETLPTDSADENSGASGTTTIGGEGVAIGAEKATPPYYPACEALCLLADETLRPDVETWAAWWTHKKAAFRFPALEAPEWWRKKRRARKPEDMDYQRRAAIRSVYKK